MIFGIWPGAAAADLVSLQPLDCPPEDVAKTLAALRQLQGTAREFYVRAYRHFGKGAHPHSGAVPAPLRPELYAGQGRMIDLVACYQSPAPDPEGFAGFVRQAVRDVAAWGGGKVQVGEELNMPAPLDGGSPGCFEAIGAGVAAALEERDRHDAPVLVGVNAAGMPDPAFWDQLTSAIGPHRASGHTNGSACATGSPRPPGPPGSAFSATTTPPSPPSPPSSTSSPARRREPEPARPGRRHPPGAWRSPGPALA